jgi:hypothetical protein
MKTLLQRKGFISSFIPHSSFLIPNFPNSFPLFSFLFSLFSFSLFANPVITPGGTVPLDSDAYVYVFADVKKIRPIIDVIPVKDLKKWQAVLVTNSTNTAAAAMFRRGTGKNFQIVGWGSYPSVTASLALFIHKNWKMTNSDAGNYWYSHADRLSVRIASKQVYAISWRRRLDDPLPPATGNARIPDGFTQFRQRSNETSPLSLWMKDSASVLNKMFVKEKIKLTLPSQMLFLNLFPAEKNMYKVELRLFFETSALTGNIAGNLLSNRILYLSETDSVLSKLFFANPPVYYGNNIDFQSTLLTVDEVMLLMNLFWQNL